MKKILIFIVTLIFSSCGNQKIGYQKLLKSSDFDLKYEMAVNYFNESNYSRALPLLEGILSEFKGSSKSEDVYYYYVYTIFHLGDYTTSAYHFKNFSKTFFSSDKSEEMAFMSAKCYYLDSPKSYYDQTTTYNAISELELFISGFPDSEKISEARDLINNLNLVLEEKAFNIAKLYYKTGKYTSSIYAFNNFIEKYPKSNLSEEVFYIQTKAYFELAKNSIEEKKELRTKEFIFAYQDFMLTYPSSKYLNELKLLKNEL